MFRALCGLKSGRRCGPYVETKNNSHETRMSERRATTKWLGLSENMLREMRLNAQKTKHDLSPTSACKMCSVCEQFYRLTVRQLRLLCTTAGFSGAYLPKYVLYATARHTSAFELSYNKKREKKVEHCECLDFDVSRRKIEIPSEFKIRNKTKQAKG